MSLMRGWTMSVRQAKFGGVSFDVLAVEDSFERAVVEHSYPFVNGADLEAMGLNPLSVSLSAVFFGESYYADFQAFLKALEKNKPDVLMHPIRGRLPNMLCVSSNFRHEADLVDYVQVDLRFEEASPAQPIFVFNNALLSLINQALEAIDNLIETILDYYDVVMKTVVTVLSVKNRLLGMRDTLLGLFDAVCEMFGKKATSPLRSGTVATVKTLSEVLNEGLMAIAEVDQVQQEQAIAHESAVENSAVFSAKSRFDELLRQVEAVLALPEDLLVGRESAPTVDQVMSALANPEQAKTSQAGFTPENMAALACTVRLLCAGLVAKAAVLLIEEEAETLLPTEIEHICTQARWQLLGALNGVRALLVEEESKQTLQQGESGVYTAMQETAEGLREVAHQMTALALSAINQKPPLMVREAPVSGALVQQAHSLYGDYSRADELLRLNPHIRYPNWVEKGTVLNGYAR
ncbi:DNA circularization protein [Lonepinella sp. BR2474]|uniref:DNA circularization protein n=1 Tax=Lonepinella sp. BR2474 TaxID=3434548 RepID=UPI003F6DA915